jgi:hypothetical protein
MAKRLSPTQRAAIKKAANRGVKFFTGKPLPSDVLENVYGNLEGIREKLDSGGKKNPVIGNEAIALWAAKIDFAIANGDRKNVGKLITLSDLDRVIDGGEVAFWDSNGGCSCGGGGGGAGSW